MIFDFSTIQKDFDKAKETHDFKEYIDEIKKNEAILNAQFFNAQEAKKQISKLTGKYREELNRYAAIHQNGMTVINNAVYITEERLYNDLKYINNLIPLFALERTGLSKLLKSQTQGGETF